MGLLSSLFGGGGIMSPETTNSTTYTADTRDQSVNNAGDGILQNGNGSLTITQTDHNAINASVELFKTGAGFAQNVAQTALTSNNEATAAAMSTSAKAADSAVTAIKDAYSTAKAGEQKIMAIAALAVVGVVAFKSVKG